MDLGLAGRTYLVTGGSAGLGRATVDALVADGARVVVSGRDADRLATVAADHGAAVATVVADNGDPDTPDRLVGMARERFGRVDGAVVSVGGPPAGAALAVTDEQWRGAFESVFLGTARLVRAVAQAIGADGAAREDAGAGGAVALVLSTSVRAPISGLAISNGLRPGLAMLGKTLADELGPRGVRVVSLLPGRFATDRVAQLDAAGGDPTSARRAAEAAIPLGRYGDPAEFGRVAAFAVSPAASYLTGVALAVDGGALRAL